MPIPGGMGFKVFALVLLVCLFDCLIVLLGITEYCIYVQYENSKYSRCMYRTLRSSDGRKEKQ